MKYTYSSSTWDASSTVLYSSGYSNWVTTDAEMEDNLIKVIWTKASATTIDIKAGKVVP